MLWPDKNIFKLSNKKYLFKYPIGKFEINFKNKDKNILSILLKDNLNHIQIITYQNIEYIFIYELDYCKDHETDFYSQSDRDTIKLKDKSYHSRIYKNKFYYELGI